MTLNIPISPDLEAKLRARATAAGKDVTTFVREAVEEKLRGPESLSEILAPVHKDFKDSGMSGKELDSLLEKAISEARREGEAKPKA